METRDKLIVLLVIGILLFFAYLYYTLPSVIGLSKACASLKSNNETPVFNVCGDVNG